jgi:hypothetical protein
MKRTILLLCLTALLAGCSGLIAKKPMAAAIDKNALLGNSEIHDIELVPLTVEQAKPLIVVNQGIFATYRSAATMNIVVYWLDPTKSILVNSAYWKLLNETAALCDEAPTWLPNMTQAEHNQVLRYQAGRLISVKNAKDGVKDTP